MIQRKGRVSWKMVPYFLTFIALVLATGCAGVNRLREAQDAFNQAAALENAIRLDGTQSANATVTSLSAVRNGYTSALLSLDKIETKDIEKLKQDGLWGNVLTIKALTQWRLGLYDKSLNSAAEAKNTVPSDQILPRDRALLEALPGLIKIDQAYSKIQTYSKIEDPHSKFEEVNILLTGDVGAIKDLDHARKTVERDHPVQIYLIQSQLAAYRNLMDAYDKLNSGKMIPQDYPARKAAQEQLKDLKGLLKTINSPEAERLIQFWIERVHLEVPQ